MVSTQIVSIQIVSGQTNLSHLVSCQGRGSGGSGGGGGGSGGGSSASMSRGTGIYDIGGGDIGGEVR